MVVVLILVLVAKEVVVVVIVYNLISSLVARNFGKSYAHKTYLCLMSISIHYNVRFHPKII